MVEVHDGPGLVSSKQREYLIGEADIEISSPDERQIRSRIRDRLRNAILDFAIVQQNLSERDRSQLADEIRQGETDVVDPEIGLYWGIGLIVSLGNQAGLERETLIDEGVLRSSRDISHVKSNLEIRRRDAYDLQTVSEKLQRGEKPTIRELGEAWINDELDDKLREKVMEIGVREEQPDVDLEEGASVWDSV